MKPVICWCKSADVFAAACLSIGSFIWGDSLEQEYRNMQMAQKLRIMTIFLMVYCLRYRDQFKGKKL